jgi:Kef-type K+ transport system membrane component KefB
MSAHTLARSHASRTLRAGLQALGIAWLMWAGLPSAHAAGGDAGETFLWLAVILVAANVVARLVERVHMPGVLGELVIGIVFGNLALIGIGVFERIGDNAVIKFCAQLGVVILLFQIGLESSLAEMRRVGVRATLVAVVGVVVPFALGTFLVGPWLLPVESFNAYLFLGATLTATSVGVTGRVFRDLGRIGSTEAQIVLGAAVIDDVLGLVILAVVSSIVEQGSITATGVGLLVAQAVVFLTGSIFIGRLIAPWLSRTLARIDAGVAMKLALVIGVCLVMAWLAEVIGLAAIVGAFAAGLVLERVFLTDFNDPEIVRELRPLLPQMLPENAKAFNEILDHHSGHHHRYLIEPLGYFFVPIFFVYTSMQVKLDMLADPKILLIALGVTVAAFIGKLVAGLAAGPVRKAVVGWGMVPRGEVGLIFAMVGKQLGVVSEQMFSVVVVMVVVTTLVTPLVLMRLLAGDPGERPSN